MSNRIWIDEYDALPDGRVGFLAPRLPAAKGGAA